MTKVVLQYDEVANQLMDSNGIFLVLLTHPLSYEEPTHAIESIIKLKKAGFTSTEIIELNNQDLL